MSYIYCLFLFSVTANIYCQLPCIRYYVMIVTWIILLTPLSSPTKKMLLLFLVYRRRDRDTKGVYNFPKAIKLADGTLSGHTWVCLIL